MTLLPKLETGRLILRSFTLADAPAVQRMAAHREIAATTLTIPHPYPDGAADAWITAHAADNESGKSAVFAVVRREDRVVCGAVGLQLNWDHRHAELGYWIGVDYWGQGYATEAAREMVRFAFEDLGLHRIFAHHFRSNPASGKVLRKIGMSHEGTLRGHILKWGDYLDIEQYGMLKTDDTPARR